VGEACASAAGVPAISSYVICISCDVRCTASCRCLSLSCYVDVYILLCMCAGFHHLLSFIFMLTNMGRQSHVYAFYGRPME